MSGLAPARRAGGGTVLDPVVGAGHPRPVRRRQPADAAGQGPACQLHHRGGGKQSHASDGAEADSVVHANRHSPRGPATRR